LVATVDSGGERGSWARGAHVVTRDIRGSKVVKGPDKKGGQRKRWASEVVVPEG